MLDSGAAIRDLRLFRALPPTDFSLGKPLGVPSTAFSVTPGPFSQ